MPRKGFHDLLRCSLNRGMRGHSCPSVTAVYADVLPEDMVKAMENFRDVEPEQTEKIRTCSLCKRGGDKPAKQLTIDGREVDVCPCVVRGWIGLKIRKYLA